MHNFQVQNDELRQVIERQLEPGERVLWAFAPGKEVGQFGTNGVNKIAIGLMGAVGAGSVGFGFGLGFVLGQLPGVGWLVAALLVIAVACGLWVWRQVARRNAQARQTGYAVTDRRVLLLDWYAGDQVQSYRHLLPHQIKLRGTEDGSLYLEFEDVQPDPSPAPLPFPLAPGLYGIEEADSVKHLILQVMDYNSSGFERPIYPTRSFS